ncbi:MAG: TRAP transporter large permease [Salinibacter sp.]
MEILPVLILLGVFVVTLAIGVPVAFCLGLSTTAALLVGIGPVAVVTTVAQRMAASLNSFPLLAIPFFILAGELMNRGGMAQRLVDFAKGLVGTLPGGLAYVNVVASMLFGAISGSAAAAASAVGGFMAPQMAEEGYDKSFSAAVNSTAATTGLLIPPSNILIVYSLASGGVSIAALFLAGYLPGLLVGLGLMAVAGYWSFRADYPTSERLPLRTVLWRFLDALPSLFMLIVVIGGIVAGIFTATEAAAVAVLYALLLAFTYRAIGVGELPDILLSTVRTTAIVMLLIATSIALSWMLSFENIPQIISEGLLGLTESRIAILLLMNLILLVVGTFMDMTPAVLIFTPLFLPIATSLGIDPVHFGMILVLNLCVGICTPPVGTVLFVGAAVGDTTISRMIRPMLPLYGAMVAALLLVTFFPSISLWLPALFGF